MTAADGTRWLVRRAWRPHRLRIDGARVERLFLRWVVPAIVLGWLAFAVTGIVSGELDPFEDLQDEPVIVPILVVVMMCLLGLGFAKIAAVVMWVVLPIVQGLTWLVSRAFLQPWEIVAEPAGLEREAVRWRGDGGLVGRAAGTYPRLLGLGERVEGPEPVSDRRPS